ncbi:hypothetical protein HA402_002043 [Bradysia odoriphaga]|nr:hypothetical protein HA402_002043 [Bradysia odoriphaga]
MAPALKVKRLKKPARRSVTAVANKKPKWEKPRKSISAQAEITKIKNVNKRSFDPIKANRGVVLLQNIPHGFYEDEMRKYFGQFGLVTRVRLARSERTGRSKGFAYIEFRVPEVAEIAAETMHNYIMFKHRLTATYIPPEKQTHNFFRKDVTFTTNANGERTFSSAKIASIEEAVANFNRELTDEEHAKRVKRDQNALQKQQQKFGVDLSNILVSGNNKSNDEAPAAEAKSKDTKKKATVAKKGAEKKPEAKRDDNKIATKKDIKKGQANGGKSLMHELLNETFETDTSDDDFKIDHTFESVDDSDGLVGLMAKKLSRSADDEASDSEFDTDDDVDTDDESGFAINDESADDEESDDDGKAEGDGDSEDDGESDDDGGWEDDDADSDDADSDDADSDDADSDDGGSYMELDGESEMDGDDSEDSESEIVLQASKDKKKLVKGAASNGAVVMKAKNNLKRKHKEDSSSIFSELATSSSQSELDTRAKRKKQSQKNDGPSIVKASIPVAEPSTAAAMSKKKQKQRKILSTSSSEPESLPPQTKQKKTKLPAQVPITSKLSSEPNTRKQKLNKKKAKQNSSGESTLSSSIADTTSSEPEVPKQKLNKKKSKLNAVNVAVQAKNEIPEGVNLKSKTEKKKNQPVKDGKTNFNQKTALSTSADLKKKNQPAKDEQTKFNPKTAALKVAEPEVKQLKKKNQPAQNKQGSFNPTTSAPALVESAAQKSKKKNQEKQTSFNPKTAASTSPTKPESQKLKNKQKIVANGESTLSKPEPEKIDKKKKKSIKATTNANSNKLSEKSKSSSEWVTVSETDGEDTKKSKAKVINANLKTIVHKNNSKKNNDKAKPLDAKKIKQTPDELLRFITSKDLKQKSKKKSK